MKTKTVVVASHTRDQSALFLMKRLAEIGQKSVMINFGDFPKLMSATISFENVVHSTMSMQNSFCLDDESVKSVWWRRPQGPSRSTRVSLLQKYIQNESEIALASSLAFLKDVLWVSEPEATRIANRKPLQLAHAMRIGFSVPATCISNDPKQVSEFIDRHENTPLIMKPVGSSYVRLTHDPDDRAKRNRAIYTKIVDINLLRKHISKVSNCPFILQEAVIKDSDIRVTVVDDKVFAAEITMQKTDGDILDWRHQDVSRSYSKHQLPHNLELQCIELVCALGLKFGCIDLGYSKKNGYAFFEINPQGQWMPSEQVVGYPISLSLARLLAK